MRKILCLALAAILIISLTACGEYRGPDIKVTNSTTSTTIYGHNGFKPGNVDIVENEDGTYTVMVTFQAPDSRRAP